MPDLGGGGQGTKETKSEVKDKKNNQSPALPLHDSTNIAIDIKTGKYGENSSQSSYSRRIH